jgi:hypothetical protein
MNWESFFIGVGCFVSAYLFHRLNKWGDNKRKSYEDITNYGYRVQGWMFIVGLIIGGVISIFMSLPSKI